MQGINLKYWRAQRFTASSIFRNSVKHRFYTNGKCSNTSSFSIWSTFKNSRNQAVISQSQAPSRMHQVIPPCSKPCLEPWLCFGLLLGRAPSSTGAAQLGVWSSCGSGRGWRSWDCTAWHREAQGIPLHSAITWGTQGYGAGTARLRRMQQEETLTICKQNSDWIEWKNSSPKEQPTPRTEFLRGLESPCLKSLKVQLKKSWGIWCNRVQIKIHILGVNTQNLFLLIIKKFGDLYSRESHKQQNSFNLSALQGSSSLIYREISSSTEYPALNTRLKE